LQDARAHFASSLSGNNAAAGASTISVDVAQRRRPPKFAFGALLFFVVVGDEPRSELLHGELQNR
jgi:hypothetical protein